MTIFMMRVPLKGEKLRECLEYAGLQYGDGGFPQISGMSLVYVDMELAGVYIGETPPTEFELDYESGDWPAVKPINAPASGWELLDDNKEYTMLTTDFLAIGGDGFPLNEDPYGSGYTGLEQRASFALWAGQQRMLEAKTDGRLHFFWVNMENPGLRD